MSTEIATTTNGALANYNDPWAKVAQSYGSENNVSYVKFDGNSGNYIAGAEKEELEPGTRFVLNMDEFKAGFICWKGGEVIDEKMVRVVDNQEINPADLPDHGPYESYGDGTTDGWSAQRSVPFKGFNGTEYVFKTTSKSGVRALANLLSDFAKSYKVNIDKLPVIEIGSVSFVPKTKKNVGKKYAPSFKIVAWMSQEEIEASMSDDDGEAAPAPVVVKEATSRRGRHTRF